MAVVTGAQFADKLEKAGAVIWKSGLNRSYFYATLRDRHVLVMFVENHRFDSAKKTDKYGHPLRTPDATLRSMAAVESYLEVH